MRFSLRSWLRSFFYKMAPLPKGDWRKPPLYQVGIKKPWIVWGKAEVVAQTDGTNYALGPCNLQTVATSLLWRDGEWLYEIQTRRLLDPVQVVPLGSSMAIENVVVDRGCLFWTEVIEYKENWAKTFWSCPFPIGTEAPQCLFPRVPYVRELRPYQNQLYWITGNEDVDEEDPRLFSGIYKGSLETRTCEPLLASEDHLFKHLQLDETGLFFSKSSQLLHLPHGQAIPEILADFPMQQIADVVLRAGQLFVIVSSPPNLQKLLEAQGWDLWTISTTQPMLRQVIPLRDWYQSYWTLQMQVTEEAVWICQQAQNQQRLLRIDRATAQKQVVARVREAPRGRGNSLAFDEGWIYWTVGNFILRSPR